MTRIASALFNLAALTFWVWLGTATGAGICWLMVGLHVFLGASAMRSEGRAV